VQYIADHVIPAVQRNLASAGAAVRTAPTTSGNHMRDETYRVVTAAPRPEDLDAFTEAIIPLVAATREEPGSSPTTPASAVTTPWSTSIQLVLREARIQGALCYTGDDYRAVIDLMARGHHDTTGWVEQIAMGDVLAEGFEALRAGQKMKVLVDPTRWTRGSQGTTTSLPAAPPRSMRACASTMPSRSKTRSSGTVARPAATSSRNSCSTAGGRSEASPP
jgi:hypothetical protein